MGVIIICSPFITSVRAEHCQLRRYCSTNALPGREIEWRARFSRANRRRPRTSCDLQSLLCALSEPRSQRIQLQSLASFLLGAFFQCRFARELYAALVVNADAFDPNH